jgi:hypothetical protein
MWFFYKNVSPREVWQAVRYHIPMNIVLMSAGIATSGLPEDIKNYCRLGIFIATYPLLTVARRLMAQSTNHTMLPRRYTSFRYAFSKIYGEEGIFRGFYRGITFNAIAMLFIITL